MWDTAALETRAGWGDAEGRMDCWPTGLDIAPSPLPPSPSPSPSCPLQLLNRNNLPLLELLVLEGVSIGRMGPVGGRSKRWGGRGAA